MIAGGILGLACAVWIFRAHFTIERDEMGRLWIIPRE